MTMISLLEATRSFEKTMTMMSYRLFIYLSVSFGYIAATLMGTGSGFAVGSMVDSPEIFAPIGAVAGFGLCGFILYRARASLLFSLRGSHLALLEKAISDEGQPAETNQIHRGQCMVKDRFDNPSALFTLAQSTKKVLTALFFELSPIARKIPNLSNGAIDRLVRWLVSLPLSDNEEAIIGFILKRKGESPEAAAKIALIYYAQNFNELLKSAYILFVLMYAGLVGAFFLVSIPVEWVLDFLPFTIGLWSSLIALLIAWSIKAAIFEPIATGVLMSILFAKAKEQTPNPEWEEKLCNISPLFNNLGK